jgi:hypothetical protein
MKKNKKWFSIIEVMVWIFIFTLWMVWVFAIISSTLRINDYNENYIIASNLANEQLELIKNIRDSNYSVLKPYNLLNPNWNTYNPSDKFEIWIKYIIENDYSNTSLFPIKIDEITDFWEWADKLNTKMLNYNLCLDSRNRYTYDCITSWNKKTIFYKYIEILPVQYMSGWIIENIDNSFLIRSKVIWNKKWYHNFEVKSIIADWKRL